MSSDDRNGLFVLPLNLPAHFDLDICMCVQLPQAPSEIDDPAETVEVNSSSGEIISNLGGSSQCDDDHNGRVATYFVAETSFKGIDTSLKKPQRLVVVESRQRAGPVTV